MGGKTSTASRTKFNQKTYERLVLNLRIDSPQSKKAIEQAASRAGQSATAYVVQAVRERMEREKASTAPASASTDSQPAPAGTGQE